MRYNRTATLQRKLRHAVAQTWMISTAAVLVAAIPIEHARGGELMDCEPQRVRGDGRHWAYRITDGRQCWYPGQRGKPKDELRWSEAPSATQSSARWNSLTSKQELPRKHLKVAAWWNRPKSRQPFPSPRLRHQESDINKVMREEWRPAAADQLLGFTCCWPELPTAVSVPQPGPGGRQDRRCLAADPAVARTLRDVVKKAQAAAFDRFRPVSSLLLVALVASPGPPRRSPCERRAQAPTAGRRRRLLTRQCTTPNKACPHRRALVPLAPRSLPSASRMAGSSAAQPKLAIGVG